MAESKITRKRKPSTKTTLTKKQLKSIGLTQVTVHMPERKKDLYDDEVPRFFRVPLATRFEFGWYFDNAEGDGEFLCATFNGEQLLKTAVSLGILRETFSRERPVPKGKLPAMRIRGAA